MTLAVKPASVPILIHSLAGLATLAVGKKVKEKKIKVVIREDSVGFRVVGVVIELVMMMKGWWLKWWWTRRRMRRWWTR